MAGILLALGIALLSGPGAGPVSPALALDLNAYVPSGRDLRGWAPSGEPQHYVGEDLYTYIDGGAEIYQEYGFKQVLAQDYKNAAGKSLTLEIYEMKNPEAAYGAFTFKASGKGHAIAIGQAAELDDYYLNVWKGPIVFTVIGFDESAESLAGIQAVAKAADAKIPAAGARPALMGRFPEDWARAPHIKYFTGALGLFNIDAFFKGDVFKSKAGAAAEIDGDWLFLFQYADESESLRRLAEIQKTLAADASIKGFTVRPDGGFEGRTSKNKTFRARTAGHLIVMALTGKGAVDAEKILASFGR
jgi:hypothetical protein